jgi:uncharacterized protein YbaR (Trm112 family)
MSPFRPSLRVQFGIPLPQENPLASNVQPIPEELCKQIHKALFEIEVMEGDLICPETERKFPIKDGIPNMLCNEDEV